MDFEAWNEGLCHRYFPLTNGPVPVFFFTDDDALGELHPSGDPSEACADLALAVQGRLDYDTNDLFRRFRYEHYLWDDSDRSTCPPGLPLLALTVNAATHMRSDNEFRNTNYYVRLRQLLGLDGQGMPEGFDYAMYALWEGLSDWLDHDSGQARGQSTIRTHPHFTNIGYPMSQALLRQSDVKRLGRLFDHLGLPPFSTWEKVDPPISPTELRIHYQIWAPTASGLSPGARELATNKDYRDLLEETLWAAVSQWETAEAAPGVGITRLFLGFSPFPRPELRFWIQRRNGMPGSLVVGNQAYTSNNDSWYESAPIELSQSHLENGIDLRASTQETSYAIEYEPASAIPFREDLIVGEWMEVRRVEPNATHWVLCSEDVSDQVEQYLQAHAGAGWQFWGEAPDLDGWFLYRNVEVVRMAPILEFPSLWRLRPAISLSLAFKGGLKVAHLGTNVYLTHGAPDLWIPPGTAPIVGPTVVVDGSIYEGPGEEGGEFRLRNLELASGHHEVQVGERTIGLHLIETADVIASADAGSLGLTFKGFPPRLRDWRVGSIVDREPDDLTVSGGIIEGTMAQTLNRPVSLLMSARESFVLGAHPDELSRVQQPEDPPWLERTDLMPSRYDHRPPFAAVWTIQKFTDAFWRVECIRRDLMPDVTDVDDCRTALDWAGLLIANETEIVAANDGTKSHSWTG